jgi:alpha-glucosidase
MRLLYFALLTFHLSLSSFAKWQSVGNVNSFSSNKNQVAIQAGKSILNINVLASDLIRVRLATNGMFQPDMSWAVVKKHWQEVEVKVTDSSNDITIATSEISLVVNKNPLRLRFVDRQGNIINDDEPTKGMSWNGSEVRVWKKMPQDEFYYGFGEKAGRLNRTWTHMTMWNSDIPAYDADTDPIYQTHPFFYGVNKGKAYGVFFDNTYWSSFDMGKENRHQYSFGAEAGEINYYFFYGLSPKKILSRYTELVGRMPLPPRWSLGYQQCRWSYPTETRVREIAKGFRDRKIPCDVIYLDIDYMDGYRIFTWNNKNFPNPKKMIDDLTKDGFKIAVIVDPGIKADTAYHAFTSGNAKDVFVKYLNGKPFIGKVWPGECAFPDFTKENARNWWGDNFSTLIESGIRGWWNDMNEPSVFDVPTKTIDLNVIHDDNELKTGHEKNHNIYGMQMTRATYDGVRRLLPNERPFVLTRASYAGGHRYSSAWTGDNTSTWRDLEMSVPMLLNLSISGQPFVGADIGGFIGHPGGELFARWLQLGVFTPLMRAHSVINEKNKEPWEYGEEFTNINRETINLRYTLLPYIYNVMYQASVTGMPAMRPMMFDYPDDGNFGWNEEQFMFGDDLLIAPVLTPSTTERNVRLPEGFWYDYWTGQKYKGGNDIKVDAPLNRIPVFVKAGAIIPTQQVVQSTNQSPIDPLTFTVYPTKLQSTRTYYEDDGISFEYEKGKYFRRTINQRNSSGGITLMLSKAEGSYRPPKRSLVVKFLDAATSPKGVEVNGKQVMSVERTKMDRVTECWSYDSEKSIVWVKSQDKTSEQKIVLEK